MQQKMSCQPSSGIAVRDVQQQQPQQQQTLPCALIRFLTRSATLPAVVDIAKFQKLSVTSDTRERLPVR